VFHPEPLFFWGHAPPPPRVPNADHSMHFMFGGRVKRYTICVKKNIPLGSAMSLSGHSFYYPLDPKCLWSHECLKRMRFNKILKLWNTKISFGPPRYHPDSRFIGASQLLGTISDTRPSHIVMSIDVISIPNIPYRYQTVLSVNKPSNCSRIQLTSVFNFSYPCFALQTVVHKFTL
jgi:hypothetical protein